MPAKRKAKKPGVVAKGMKRNLGGRVSKFQNIKDSLITEVFPHFEVNGKKGAKAVLEWANKNPSDFVIKVLAKVLPRETNTTTVNLDGLSIRELSNAQLTRELEDRGISLGSALERPSDGTTNPVH